MVPNLSKAGHSFKGAFEYHTHDKGRTDSAERVDWTSTRNLMTDDAKTAERVMIATALDADRLKERAGIKATGRKSSAHVQTLSLAWHPGENPTREDMERAADSALKALGLEDYQAFISAHNDTAHKHLHIIINRVHPQDGRMAGLSNSKRVLDRWAHDYEKARGQIVTPQRAEKYARQAEAREKYTAEERRQYVQQKRAAQAQAVKAEGWRAPNPWAAQAARQKAMSERHSAQWRDLNERHKAEHRGDYAAYRSRLKDARERHDRAWTANAEHRKGEWSAFYREQRQHERGRRQMERSPAGFIALAITAAREERRQGSKESLARLTWSNLVSRSRREAVFQKVQDRDRAALAERQRFGRNKEFEHMATRRAQEIERRRNQQAEERSGLKAAQAGERAAIQRAWDELRARPDTRPARPRDLDRPTDRQDERRKGARSQLEGLRAGRAETGGQKLGKANDWDAVAAKAENRDRPPKQEKPAQKEKEARTDQAAEARERLAQMRAQREKPRQIDRTRTRSDDRDR